MENAVVVPLCLQWDIHNPFLPWRRMEATFYSCSVGRKQWRMVIEPMGRDTMVWRFSFHLTCIDSELEPTRTSRVHVDMSINGRQEAREERFYYNFHAQNRYTYWFETDVVMRPRLRVPHLIVRVEVDLLGPPHEPPSRFVLSDEDLEQLSRDLHRLLTDIRYSNMQLLPREDGAQPFQVHSCIIAARWDNFFEQHNIYENIEDENIEVETNISEDLLLDILTYMYSGTLGRALMEANYVTELFQVINLYRLHHLFNVFVKHDSHQLRETRKSLATFRCMFPLDDVDGEWLDDPSRILHVDPPSPYASTFRIKIIMVADDAWLWYSLQSQSQREMHAHVHLEFVKRTFRGRTRDRAKPVHSRDYYLSPGSTVESGDVRFVDDSEIFDHFLPADRLGLPRRRRQHFIRCVLHLSDGTSVMYAENTLDSTIRNDRERFKVLGDHMHGLLIRGSKSDFRLRCLTEIPGYPEQPDDTYLIHKAIFATRVPSYWRVLGNVRSMGDIPDDVTCTFRSEVFSHILLYIYTGQISFYPLPYLDQVRRFAEQGGFEALQSLVDRMLNVGQINNG